MSPTMRVLRTMVQVVLAEAAAIPGAVQTLGVDAATAAKVGAVCGAVVIVVSAAWNTAERLTGRTVDAVPLAAAPTVWASGPPADRAAPAAPTPAVAAPPRGMEG